MRRGKWRTWTPSDDWIYKCNAPIYACVYISYAQKAPVHNRITIYVLREMEAADDPNPSELRNWLIVYNKDEVKTYSTRMCNSLVFSLFFFSPCVNSVREILSYSFLFYWNRSQIVTIRTKKNFLHSSIFLTL